MPTPRSEHDTGVRVRVGCDVVGVDRFAGLLAQQAGLAEELFSAAELRGCATGPRRTERLAARFAAKEAVLKALGTGLTARMRWTDVEVANNYRGRPTVRLSGAVAARARACGVVELDVTLSHIRELAMATAVSVQQAQAPQRHTPQQEDS